MQQNTLCLPVTFLVFSLCHSFSLSLSLTQPPTPPLRPLVHSFQPMNVVAQVSKYHRHFTFAVSARKTIGLSFKLFFGNGKVSEILYFVQSCT